MQKIQTQGVHHITLIGADRQSSIDFWEGVLGMPFIFEQPNLDVPDQEVCLVGRNDHRYCIWKFEAQKKDATAASDGIEVPVDAYLECAGLPMK